MSVFRLSVDQLDRLLARPGYRIAGARKVTPLRDQEKQAKRTQRAREGRTQSERLIDQLVAAIMKAGHPEPAREYRFDTERKFRFDLAIHCAPPRGGVGVELDGLWATGAHTLPTQAARDREKDALALQRGWIVVRVTPSMVRSGAAMEAIRHAIAIRTGSM